MIRVISDLKDLKLTLQLSEEGRVLLCGQLGTILPLLTMPGNLIVRRNTARLLRNLSLDAKNHTKLLEHLPMVGEGKTLFQY